MTDQRETSDQQITTTVLPGGSGVPLLSGTPLGTEYESLQLPGYELISIIGHGGMGVVFLARQERLDRSVAVKMLPIEMAQDQKTLRRLEREARTIAAMHHANIIACHDIITANEATFLILEYVPGKLTAKGLLLRFGRLPEQVALRIALDTARGLAYAHEKGVIHRDIKPQNLLIFRENDDLPANADAIFNSPSARVMICDFGIAKRQEAAKDPQESDMDSRIVGSPAYLSPEQATVGIESDFRSDIYSLATTLYRLLTDLHPFLGSTAYETIQLKLDTNIPDVRDAGADVSAEFAAIIQRMGMADREERYQNYEELIAQLEVLDARFHSSTIQLSEALFRRAFWSGLALGGICFLLLGIVLSTVKVKQLFRSPPISKAASLSFWRGDRSVWRALPADIESGSPTLTGFSRPDNPLILRQPIKEDYRLQLKVRLPNRKDGVMRCRLYDDMQDIRFEFRWRRIFTINFFVITADGRDIPLIDIVNRDPMEWLELDFELKQKHIELSVDGKLTAMIPLKKELGTVYLALSVPKGNLAEFKDIWLTTPNTR